MTMEFRDLILAYRSLTMQEIKVDTLLPAADEILKKRSIASTVSIESVI